MTFLVPAPSRLIRGLLLLGPPLIALAIFLDGQRYDPGLIDFKNSQTAGSAAAKFFPDRLTNLQRLGKTRQYSKETLYEYINGHAEFFVGNGFQSLTVADYGNAAGQENSPLVTIDLFDMGKPLHAFGVLVDEAGEGSESVDIGQMGFQTGQNLTFINGRYYGKLSVFDKNQPLEIMAKSLIEAMGDVGGGEGVDFDFPEFGEVVSTRFVKESYRGLDFLANVVERRFERGGVRVEAFLVRGKVGEIAGLVGRLKAFLEGEEIDFAPVEGGVPGLVAVTDPYEGDWFFVASGGRLLGVFGVTPEEVRGALEGFLKR